jgi:hypothetical protein
MDRRAKALSGINIKTSSGLEFGPLASPFVRREEGPIFYADHASTEELKKKYAGHGWNTATIVDVDLVLDSRALKKQIYGRTFDYTLASHVIEHVPNLVGWLSDLQSILSPSGCISLVIPDKRYCFDLKRPLSTTGELVQAFVEKRTTATFRQIFDFWAFYCQVDAASIWNRSTNTETLPVSGTLENAFEKSNEAINSGVYSDVHCWVFTPASFLNNLADLVELKLLSLKIKNFVDTAYGELEFFVTLQSMTATDSELAIADEFRKMAASLHPSYGTPPPVASEAEIAVQNAVNRFGRPVFKTLKSFSPKLAEKLKATLKK